VRFGELVAVDAPYSFVRLYEGRLEGGFALDTDNGVEDFCAASNRLGNPAPEVAGVFRTLPGYAPAVGVPSRTRYLPLSFARRRAPRRSG
jgi:hypothetical protein